MRKNLSKKLAVETLERRDLMATGDPYVIQLAPAVDAGNVTAEVIDGTLFIRGDTKGNQIQLFGHSNGTVSIIGLNGPSTVNEKVTILHGSQAKIVTLDGVVNGVNIEMGDGDDVVWLDGSLPDVAITTGRGNDQVLFGGIDRDFFPSSAIGMAIIPATALMIEGDLTIDTGDGDDTIRPYAIVARDADISSGSGDDVFAVTPPALDSAWTLQVIGQTSVDAGPDQSPANSLPANVGRLLVGWDLIGYGIPYYPLVNREAVAAFLILDAVQSRVTAFPDGQILTFDDLGVLGWPIPQLRGDSSILLNIRFASDDPTFLSRASALGVVPYATAEEGGEMDAWVTHEQVLALKDLTGLEQVQLQSRAIAGPLPLATLSADVNGDGVLAPNDALFVINALNDGNDVPLSARTDIDDSFLVDVNRDGQLSPVDALIVIHAINEAPVASDMASNSALSSDTSHSPPEGESSVVHRELFAIAADDICLEFVDARRGKRAL